MNDYKERVHMYAKGLLNYYEVNGEQMSGRRARMEIR